MKRYRRDFRWFQAIRAYHFHGMDFDETPCVYCGMPAESVDHFIPAAYARAISDTEPISGIRLSLVPACRECNSVASDAVFQTIAQKRKYIQAKLRRRYQKLLRIPLWRDEDFEELSPGLARYVTHGLRLQEIISNRLIWPRGSVRAERAARRSLQLDPGTYSAENNVG